MYKIRNIFLLKKNQIRYNFIKSTVCVDKKKILI